MITDSARDATTDAATTTTVTDSESSFLVLVSGERITRKYINSQCTVSCPLLNFAVVVKMHR